MSTAVTIRTSASDTLLVPFYSDTVAAAVQADLDAGANPLATASSLTYFFAPDARFPATVPTVSGAAGFLDTIPGAQDTGYLNSAFSTVVNAGAGMLTAIPLGNATLIGGQDASTLFLNASSAGKAYLAGGHSVIRNSNSASRIDVLMDGAPDSFATTSLILDNTAGGTIDVAANDGALVVAQGGGAQSVVANHGTVVVLDGGVSLGVVTVAASAGATAWVGVGGSGGFIVNQGAGDAFVFPVGTGHAAATLFGGTRDFGGGPSTAPAATGHTTVLGMDGWLESGSAGGSIMQSGTGYGAATLVAGGSGDVLLLRSAADVAFTGDGAGVFVDASNGVTVNGGVTFHLGAGSGTVLGASIGHNHFLIEGAGNYTVAGFHDITGVVRDGWILRGSLYDLMPGSAGAHITILDFLPQNHADGAIIPYFDGFGFGVGAGLPTVTSLTNTPLGGGYYDNALVLSDGTTVSFPHTLGAVYDLGGMII